MTSSYSQNVDGDAIEVFKFIDPQKVVVSSASIYAHMGWNLDSDEHQRHWNHVRGAMKKYARRVSKPLAYVDGKHEPYDGWTTHPSPIQFLRYMIKRLGNAQNNVLNLVEECNIFATSQTGPTGSLARAWAAALHAASAAMDKFIASRRSELKTWEEEEEEV